VSATRTRPVTTDPLIAAGVPAAPPLPDDLEALLRRLRLPHIRRHAPEVLATAKAQHWEPAEVLRALFGEEARRSRAFRAGHPPCRGCVPDRQDPRRMEARRLLHPGADPAGTTHPGVGAPAENLVVCGPSVISGR
jgi:hypothetical protein